MSWLEKAFDFAVAVTGSLICAALVCLGAFYILIRFLMFSPVASRVLESPVMLFIIFGGLFIIVFGLVMSLYRMAASRSR